MNMSSTYISRCQFVRLGLSLYRGVWGVPFSDEPFSALHSAFFLWSAGQPKMPVSWWLRCSRSQRQSMPPIELQRLKACAYSRLLHELFWSHLVEVATWIRNSMNPASYAAERVPQQQRSAWKQWSFNACTYLPSFYRKALFLAAWWGYIQTAKIWL